MRHAGGRRTGMLLALMAGVSLTEGFGVLTLLPVLDRLQGTGGTIGWEAQVAAVLGFVPSLAWLLAFMTILAAARCLLVYARQVSAVALQNEVVDGVRARAFAAVLHGEWRWLAAARASDHADLILTNVSRVGIGLNQLIASAALAVAAAGYLGAALLLSWRVALVTVVLGAGVLALFAAERARAGRFGVAIGEGGRATHAYVHQTLTGIRVIKAYRGEDRRMRGFAGVIDALRARALAHERMTARGQALLQFGSATALALVLGIGHLGFGVALPVLLPLLLAFARLVPMLGSIQAGWSAWNQARPAIAEAARFLGEAGAMREPAGDAPTLPVLAEAIRLDGVTVRHPGRGAAALDGVSLTLPALTTTALVGASGAGKSTLADVLMGLVAPDAGTMRVDGVAIDGVARIAWRGAVAYVQQDAFLFHDSVRANVLLGRALGDKAVRDALVRAGAGFVLDLPDGLDTVVGDAGARLSGGERQRVALARALVGSPALLILDEATSALDPEHEMAVRETIRGLRGQVTVLFITHRESMRADADQVVTLAAGRVVA